MSELPQGWAAASVDDTGEYINGMAFKPKDWEDAGRPIIRIQNLTDPEKPLNRTSRRVEGRYLVEPGDILVSWSATLDAFIWDREQAVLNQHIFKVVPDETVVEKPYLFHSLRRVIAEMLESEHLHGSTMKHINRGPFLAHPFPLPPLPEQRRIVANIDSLTGKSRRARDHLDHIPRLVEKYKQAVLAAAFRGQLVGLSTTEIDLPHDRCWDLPSSWRWARFSDVVEIASNLVKPEEIPDLPHIAPDNVEGGTGRLLPFRTIREDGVISAKHRFFAGQVIYSKIRPYLRKAVLVDFDGACSADMYPLTSKDNLDATYLLYWLISEPFAGFTVEHEGRTVLPKINQQGLNQTPVPLPPLPDQLETVRRLRMAFNWIDRLASEATSARRLIDRLDQAVLAKAFRGELVPQDPDDEPASVLLERVRAERGAVPSNRRQRRSA